MSACQVIGVGSEFGDDCLGWAVVKALKERIKTSKLAKGLVTFSIISRSDPGILEIIAGSNYCIIVDAVLSGGIEGTVKELSLSDFLQESPTLSSHGFGLAQTLLLGERLESLPKKLEIFCIEARVFTTTQSATKFSIRQQQAIKKLSGLILKKLEKM